MDSIRTSSEAEHWRDLTPQQRKSGLAAWLGWTFDGLEMHLYTLVYAQFVTSLLGATSTKDPQVGYYASIIQGLFMLGWALGGGFFGHIGDRLGRSRTLCLTILTYALFTGLSALAHTWWQLGIFRFLSALGIGGEWAVGASLLAETWPRRWRPWIAAVLQTGVNAGILLAILTHYLMADVVAEQPRWLFLVGILPALLVLWIRRAVPETAEWQTAKAAAGTTQPTLRDLFRGPVRRTTWLVIAVCALGLTGHWAFMFWSQLHFKNLPDVIGLSDRAKADWGRNLLYLVIISSVAGNFAAAALARTFGYRKTIAVMSLGYFAGMLACYALPHPHHILFWLLAIPGFFQGLFALYTMYLPALFPTLLRTTGAGFCYNIGRVVSAAGVISFGLAGTLGDYRATLLLAGSLFLPAAFVARFLPDHRDSPSRSPANQPA
jgi:MFS family permease